MITDHSHDHSRKITATDVAKLRRAKALVPDRGHFPGLNNPNGVHTSVVKLSGAANFSGDVGHARLSELMEGPESEVFDL